MCRLTGANLTEQREIIKIWDHLELLFLVTALPLNTLYNCIKFQVDIFHTVRVMLRTKSVTYGQTDRRTNEVQSNGSCALHFGSLQETCIPSLESFELIVTKLCSGQEISIKGDNSETGQGRVMVPVYCTSLQLLLPLCEVWRNSLHNCLSYAPDKKFQ